MRSIGMGLRGGIERELRCPADFRIERINREIDVENAEHIACQRIGAGDIGDGAPGARRQAG